MGHYLLLHLHLQPPIYSISTKLSLTNNNSYVYPKRPTTTRAILQNKDLKKPNSVIPTLISLALTATLSSPLLFPCFAIPSLNSASSFPSLTTPFSQSKNLETGLENGKIRPCPSTNPGCISTNPKSSSFAFPWRIPEDYSDNAIQKLKEAILKTQRNVKFEVDENTPDGRYLEAEVDGGFSRDVLEFLVKGDVVAYRAVAKKVTYVYPFTTSIGDSKGQEERLNRIVDQLGWFAPSFDAMEMD